MQEEKSWNFSPQPGTVNPFSEDYKQNRKKQLEGTQYLPADNCFGIQEIMNVVAECSQEKDLEYFDPQMLHDDSLLDKYPQIRQVLLKLKMELYLKKSEKNEKGKYVYVPGIQEFLDESFSDPDLAGQLSNFFSRNVSLTTFNFNHIPDKLFLAMVLRHSDFHVKKVEEFVKKESKLRASFLKRLQELVQDGALDVDFHTVVNKINKYVIHLQDVLTQDKRVDGQIEDEKDTVHLSTLLDPETELETYIHEMMHVASGNTSVFQSGFMIKQVNPDGLLQTKGIIKRDRIGVCFMEGKIQRLYWLNEAVTEDLTLLFLTKFKDDKFSYPEEAKLFEFLAKSGKNVLPKKLFYDAYFEDTTRGEMKDSPKFRRLMEAVDESYGKKDFLIRLDDFIKKNEEDQEGDEEEKVKNKAIDKAIEALQNNPDQI